MQELKKIESMSIISANLIEQINDLFSGAVIEKVSNDAEYSNLLEFGKLARNTRLDADKERKEKLVPHQNKVNTINAEYNGPIEGLKFIEDQAKRVCGAYQFEKKRIDDQRRRETEAKAQAERRRLAEEESRRLAEEEAKRKEAEEKLKAADQANNDEEKARLTEEANQASAAAEQAEQAAEQAAIECNAVPVKHVEEKKLNTRGLSAKIVYVPEVSDYRAALKWFVDNGEFGFLEGKALEKLIEGAVKKVANIQKEKFRVSGCSVKEEISGSIRG